MGKHLSPTFVLCALHEHEPQAVPCGLFHLTEEEARNNGAKIALCTVLKTSPAMRRAIIVVGAGSGKMQTRMVSKHIQVQGIRVW